MSAPIVVLLASDAFGEESFQYVDLDAALAGMRRLFIDAQRSRATDGVNRRIILCVGELPRDADELSV